MNKISCELCGTVYPDTEERCPTCGTEKPETAEFITPVREPRPRREYTPTKGGRFSEANVKKRLQSKGIAPAAPAAAAAPKKKAEAPKKQPRQPRQEAPVQQSRQQEKSGSNKGLVIAAVILSLAIVAMLFYIYITFLRPKPAPETQPNEQANQQHQQIPDTKPVVNPNTEPDLSCKSLILSESVVTLNQAGGSWLLNVTPEPANTVNPITYVSADTNVATVSADGMVTAVGSGETVITVTCGVVKVEVKVVCDLVPPTETTVPEETTAPTEPTVPNVDFKLRKEDVTFSKQGETWLAYKGELPLNEIVWTSSNTNVATVTNGTVRAVGPGKCVITGNYKGIEATCIIRCNF